VTAVIEASLLVLSTLDKPHSQEISWIATFPISLQI
jgi:hypothetical protein